MADVGNKNLLLQNTMFPKQKTYSPEYNTQELRDLLNPESSIATDNVIQMGGMQMLPEQPEDDTNFLGSLIAQGAAGIGTGLMGGSASDIQRSSNLFDRMREADINRQNRLKQNELLRTERLAEKEDRLKQNELLRTEKLAEKQAKLSEFKTKEDQEKRLADPNSDESIRERLLYEKVLKTPIPKEVSAYDLKNNKELVRSLISQAEQQQPKLTGIPARQRSGVSGAGGRVGKPKPEKEVKTDEKRLGIYRGLAESLSNSINVIENVEKLNRFRGGSFFPTINIDKKVTESLINQNAQPLIKQLAGVGTITDPEREEFKKLVPNADMSKEEALKLTQSMAQKSVIGTLEALNFDLQTGQISKKDYDTIIRLYNKNLSNPKLGINKIINEQGELVDSTQTQPNTKIVTDKQTGKRYEVDQEGNVVKEL